MTKEELRLRCCRIIGFHPESTMSILDCMRHLGDMRGIGRGIAAENLARELAEFVASHCGDSDPRK